LEFVRWVETMGLKPHGYIGDKSGGVKTSWLHL